MSHQAVDMNKTNDKDPLAGPLTPVVPLYKEDETDNGSSQNRECGPYVTPSPGTGKTHLATALGQAACMQGKRVRFFSVTALVTQLLEAREDRQLERFLKRLEKQHLIILDEFGYVPFSKAGAELLFEVVSRAYERTSLILTTNLPFEHWTEVLGNERLAGALLDRITHRVHIIEANGESYRLRDARRRAKRKRDKSK